ncbi:MAG: hypothetical protein K8S24_05095, partial [Candidatus Aegiribacteria sp.]|nr:hypothetical protein [Candidatus Aegiribacteria sp.]
MKRYIFSKRFCTMRNSWIAPILITLSVFIIASGSEAQSGSLRMLFSFDADNPEISDSLLTELNSQLSDDPSNTSLLLERGALLACMGETDAATEDAAKVIELEPDKPDGYILTAAVALHLEDCENAIDYAARAIELAPDSVDAYTIRVMAATYLGLYQQALEDSYRIAELEPDNVGNYNTMAALEVQLGQYDSAYSHYSFAISLAPDSALYLCNRGLFLLNAGQPDEALEDLNMAISVDSTNAHAHAIRARFYLESPYRAVDLALEDLSRAIELEPDNSLRYRQRAAAFYYQLGDFEATIEDMNQAVIVAPFDAVVIHARGVFYMEHGDLDSAIADF